MTELEEALVGRRITGARIDEYENGILELDNGRTVKVVSNDGCGGCSSGWYTVTQVAEVDNVITSVIEDVDPVLDQWADEAYKYTIFVVTADAQIAAAVIEGDDGNGYYGSGYYIEVSGE